MDNHISTIDRISKRYLSKLIEMNDTHFDLVIVGAGFSGLEVAIQLSEKWKNQNKRILVLEQADYVGGRIRTVKDTYKGKQFSYEAGGARFNNNHKTLISVISRYKLKSKIIKIPSFWEFKPSSKYIKKANTVEFDDIEDLLKSLVSYYNKPKHQTYLKTVTLYEACRDLYGDKVADFLKHSYSYYSEIKVFNGVNAIKSLSNDLSETNQFYMLKGGLSQIAINQAIHFKTKIYGKNDKRDTRLVCLKMQVGNWKYNDNQDNFTVNVLNMDTDETLKVSTTNLVLAVNGKSIRRWRSQLNIINPKINNVLSHVTSQPLMRTYAIYDSVWFKNYGKVVTDELVKYIIPIDYKIGLIMISYTDGEYVRRMMKHIENGTQKEAIYKSLKEIFPEDKIEKNPKYLRNEYWDTGAVYWNRGANSKEMSKFMQKPSIHHRLFICGDSFSENQAWTDGALYSAQKVSKLIK
tara:strand:- start:336 stop:1727 length:1392 start_codon:yes stop_codon:yes gene_type:complete